MKLMVNIDVKRLSLGNYQATSSDIPELEVKGESVAEVLDKAQDKAYEITESYNTPISKNYLQLRVHQTHEQLKYIPDKVGYYNLDINKTKLIPLFQWICDSCGSVIETPEEGWFEWYSEMNSNICTGFRIVHHDIKCQYNEQSLYAQRLILHDLNLTDILGDDGLGYLTDFINDSIDGARKLKSISEITEIIKRVSIPYWEEARQYWKQARDIGYKPIYTAQYLVSIINEFSESEETY